MVVLATTKKHTTNQNKNKQKVKIKEKHITTKKPLHLLAT
jgi:hypothetical protein